TSASQDVPASPGLLSEYPVHVSFSTVSSTSSAARLRPRARNASVRSLPSTRPSRRSSLSRRIVALPTAERLSPPEPGLWSPHLVAGRGAGESRSTLPPWHSDA